MNASRTKIKILRIVLISFLVLPALCFLFTGFRWLVAPDDAAGALLMPLLTGSGLGSQMGDIGGMFLAMGLIVLGAVVTEKGDWLMPVSILLGCIVLYRLLAFALYGAPLAFQMILFELVLSIWFGFASRLVKPREESHAR
jgi:hypothetical protein